MSDISVGAVGQLGSRTFIFGTSSQLDTQSLINAAVAQKTARADRLDIRVENNNLKFSAYEQAQTLSRNLQTALTNLKGSSRLFDDSTSIFDQRSGSISASGNVDPFSILDVSVDPNAEIGQYDIEVIQDAKAQVVLTNSVADADADLGYGVFAYRIGLAGGSVYDVQLGAGASLRDIANAINAVSDDSGVKASIIKVSETEYKMSLTAQETNTEIDVNYWYGPKVFKFIGLTDVQDGPPFTNELQAPREAIVSLNGVQVTRDSNTIDDLIDGVVLDIKDEAPGTIITLDIGNDTQGIKDAITGFIDAYNAFKDFVIQNQQVSADGVVADSAVLFSDFALDNLTSGVLSLIGDDFSTNSSVVATLRDMGITLTSANKLAISDEAKLDNAILNNPDEVQGFFSSSATINNSNLGLIRNDTTGGSLDFAMNITYSGGAITNVSVGGNSSLFTINGTSITGNAGTIYEGLQFSYQGTSSATVNISINQGFANRLDSFIDGYSNSVDGIFQTEKATLQDANSDLTAEAAEIRTKAEAFRERQLEKYANFEAQLQALKLLITQIRSILGTNNDDN